MPKKCNYENCQEEATDWVYCRETGKVIKTCYKHAKIVVDEDNPEYIESCPRCGCWIPIN